LIFTNDLNINNATPLQIHTRKEEKERRKQAKLTREA
jgi:hypothetical protein